MKETKLSEAPKLTWEAPVLITFSASTLTKAGATSTTTESVPTTQTAPNYSVS
jgi:hypothetical protein